MRAHCLNMRSCDAAKAHAAKALLERAHEQHVVLKRRCMSVRRCADVRACMTDGSGAAARITYIVDTAGSTGLSSDLGSAARTCYHQRAACGGPRALGGVRTAKQNKSKRGLIMNVKSIITPLAHLYSDRTVVVPTSAGSPAPTPGAAAQPRQNESYVACPQGLRACVRESAPSTSTRLSKDFPIGIVSVPGCFRCASQKTDGTAWQS